MLETVVYGIRLITCVQSCEITLLTIGFEIR